jgi:hypothetical protein
MRNGLAKFFLNAYRRKIKDYIIFWDSLKKMGKEEKEAKVKEKIERNIYEIRFHAVTAGRYN